MQQRNVLEYLEKTVKEVPDKTAYEDGSGNSMTFLQVYDTSRSIGTCLANKGYYAEPVVIFMKKTPFQIAAFMGVIAAGCFYVSIDEEMPRMRIDLIFQTLKPRVMICDEDTKDAAADLGFEGEILTYGDITDAADDSILSDIRRRQIDTDPIYVVFTSGSTGVPKGVVACHRSVIDYIEQLSAVLRVDRDTVFGNQSPFSFDACLKEIYPTLKYGARAVIVPRELFMFPIKLVEFLNEHKINTVCWVVSALTMISAFKTFDKVKPEYLRTVAFGSEVFPIKQFRLWRQALPQARFINLYGPTEATGMSCYFEVDRDFEEGEVIPIGRPFDNTRIILLDEENREAQEGEICISGTAVTMGYYADPERTDAVFVQNPLNSAYREIIYRTGDIGRMNSRGELEFVSRKDNQIKHMGHRIELGEIEANVAAVEGTSLNCAVYNRDKDRIVLYYTGQIGRAALTEELKKKLPRFMIPSKIIQLDDMPLTANGKIDRNNLKNRGE